MELRAQTESSLIRCGCMSHCIVTTWQGWTVLACWRLADGPPPPSSNTVVEEAREAARPGRPAASPSTSPRGKGEESAVAGTPETPARSGSSETVAGSAMRQRRQRDGGDDVGGEGGESHRAATGEGAQSGQAVRDPRQTHWELYNWRCISNEPSMALAVGCVGMPRHCMHFLFHV